MTFKDGLRDETRREAVTGLIDGLDLALLPFGFTLGEFAPQSVVGYTGAADDHRVERHFHDIRSGTAWQLARFGSEVALVAVAEQIVGGGFAGFDFGEPMAGQLVDVLLIHHAMQIRRFQREVCVRSDTLERGKDLHVLAAIGEEFSDRDAGEVSIAIDDENVLAYWLVLQQNLLGRADVRRRRENG